MPQHAFIWPLGTPLGLMELYGEQPRKHVENQLHRFRDVDGELKVNLYGDAHYSNHLFWRFAVEQQCALRLLNLTYIRTADSHITHLLRPLFAHVRENEWPAPPDMSDCVQNEHNWYEDLFPEEYDHSR